MDHLDEFLSSVRTVAVLGAHTDPIKPAFYVPADLHRSGIRIVPVNALLAGQTAHDETIRASLADIDEPVDILDVFRRPEALSAHLHEILAMKRRPKLVWLQSGIRDAAFAQQIQSEGMTIVQDRCLMLEHRRVRTPRSTRPSPP